MVFEKCYKINVYSQSEVGTGSTDEGIGGRYDSESVMLIGTRVTLHVPPISIKSPISNNGFPFLYVRGAFPSRIVKTAFFKAGVKWWVNTLVNLTVLGERLEKNCIQVTE